MPLFSLPTLLQTRLLEKTSSPPFIFQSWLLKFFTSIFDKIGRDPSNLPLTTNLELMLDLQLLYRLLTFLLVELSSSYLPRCHWCGSSQLVVVCFPTHHESSDTSRRWVWTLSGMSGSCWGELRSDCRIREHNFPGFYSTLVGASSSTGSPYNFQWLQCTLLLWCLRQYTFVIVIAMK